MIFSRSLTAKERSESKRNIARYNLINGISFVCNGETVMVLAAVRLGCPDAVSTAIGTMLYVGFIMLPLGRFAAARWGAAKSSSVAWLARNCFALVVAAALVWARGNIALASVLVLIGSFGFYGCRAAAVVLQGPLNGEATTPEERSRVIGWFGALFYLGMTIGLSGVLFALSAKESSETLVAVICVGSCFGAWSSWFLGRAHESSELRDGARQPIMADMKAVFSDRGFKRLVASGCALNLVSMLVSPASVVAFKRGCGATDFQALLYNASGVIACCIGSWATGPMGRRWGPRKEMLGGYLAVLATCIFWIVLPSGTVASAGPFLVASWIFLFFWLGFAKSVIDNSIMHYYISSTEPKLRVSASIALYTAMGALAGLVGITLSAFLMSRVSAGGVTAVPGPRAMASYKEYFMWILCLLAAPVALVWRVIPLPEEVRSSIGSGSHHIGPRPHHS